ncbi:MAG: replication factor C large subunit [Candidatus Ranarchaeia archaeon]
MAASSDYVRDTGQYLPWTEKYRPRSVKEIVGQGKAIGEILSWLKEWENKPPKYRAALLIGPTGVGKTSAVEAIASDLKIDLFELNASDFRNRDNIERLAGSAAYQGTLTDDPNRLRLILIDEADGLSGAQDRGGIQALTSIVKDSCNPIVITASDPYNPKLSTLKRYCLKITFRRLGAPSIKKRIAQILHREKIYLEPDALAYLCDNAHGDMRSAVTDLQVLAAGLNDPDEVITKKLAEQTLSPRDKGVAIFRTLETLFRAKTVKDALLIQRMADTDYDLFKRWISENIPYVLTETVERADAYAALASGDLHMQRARQTGNWGLLSYGIELMSAGVALSQYAPLNRFVRFQFPSWIGMLSRARSARIRTQEIATYIGHQLHVGHRIARDQYIPMIRSIFATSIKKSQDIITGLRLTEEMVNHIAGSDAYHRIFPARKKPRKAKRAKRGSS